MVIEEENLGFNEPRFIIEQVALLAHNPGFKAVLEMMETFLGQTLDDIQLTTDPKEAFRLLRFWQNSQAFVAKLRQAPAEIIETMTAQAKEPVHEEHFTAQW